MRETAVTAQDLVRFIEARRLPLSSEGELQRALMLELEKAGVSAEKQVRLSREDIIDIMVGSVGIELKIKGQRRAIYRQCERYCAHETVHALVLATNAAMGMPQLIHGKPAFVARLGHAWL